MDVALHSGFPVSTAYSGFSWTDVTTFQVLGVATFLWGVILFRFLPDSIESAEFLTSDERKIAEQRIIIAGTGSPKRSWKLEQCVECFLDPKTWFFFCILLSTQVSSLVNSLYNLLLISPDRSWGNSELQKPCPRRLWFYVVANNSGLTSVLFDFLLDNDWDVCHNFTSALSVQRY